MMWRVESALTADSRARGISAGRHCGGPSAIYICVEDAQFVLGRLLWDPTNARAYITTNRCAYNLICRGISLALEDELLWPLKKIRRVDLLGARRGRKKRQRDALNDDEHSAYVGKAQPTLCLRPAPPRAVYFGRVPIIRLRFTAAYRQRGPARPRPLLARPRIAC